MKTAVLNHFHTFYPDAQAELNRLAQEDKRLALMQARRGEVDPDAPKPKQRASEPLPEVGDLEAQRAELKAKMEAQQKIIAKGVVRLVVKGLTRGEYRRLLVEHGPREDVELDKALGYNSDTFGDALIQACIVKTLAHELNGGKAVKTQWDKWADEMPNGHWEEIFRTCMNLTNEPAPVFPR